MAKVLDWGLNFGLMPLGEGMNFFILAVMAKIVSQLFLYQDGFGTK